VPAPYRLSPSSYLKIKHALLPVRAGLCYRSGARWPEGRVCVYCYEQARRRIGVCVLCGHQGAVPGLNIDRGPTFLRRIGIALDLIGRRCGAEGDLDWRRICWRCVLTATVNQLLTGPDGQVPAALRPLATALCGTRRPNSG
jgi:hypothetical protein